MSRMTLEQAARWCGGTVAPQYAQVSFLGASNDSRSLEPGQLFVALEGARDGHEFIPGALAAGAAAVLCSRCDGDFPAIVVRDPRKALGDIARQERIRLNLKVVGVTGSVGKSTTKEMIAGILSRKYRTGKTPVNHNNDIGMPMAILALPEDTEVAVLEMGMNHFGEMAYLTSIAAPDIAVITNIGTMHIEHLGSREGILHAKLEILQGLRPGGKLVYNGDEPLLWNLRGTGRTAPLYFGLENPACTVRCPQMQEWEGRTELTVAAGETTFQVGLPVEGRHFVYDALAAVAVAQLLEVPTAQIQQSLAAFQSMEGRQEIYEAGGYTIIQDCYNAGPESMAASLAVLGKRAGRRIAVLGDMLELGVCTQAEHYRVGRIAAGKCDLLLALGKNAGRVVNGAITGGMRPLDAMAFDNAQDLIDALRARAKPGDILLFKGSRGMKMEQVLNLFLGEK
ncbi:MAG: UDP-N-acetylmuramoyl-tripeptide--D-alanyl-D-alanine ligase [Oscillospiraceae bacterium]|nr:UDP-N-acetylmuramoyl-tripeptide--D-alanyl-D-alanine ligase [Bacillota bacterium]